MSEENIRNIWGKKFKNEIMQVFGDEILYQSICNTILERKRINRSQFMKWDWFPTKTYIARYYSEIASIVKKRYRVYKNYSRDTDPFVTLDKSVRKFIEAYPGKRKLSISQRDNNLTIRNIERAINLERKLFLHFLGRQDISVSKRKCLLHKRTYITRFS